MLNTNTTLLLNLGKDFKGTISETKILVKYCNFIGILKIDQETLKLPTKVMLNLKILASKINNTKLAFSAACLC